MYKAIIPLLEMKLNNTQLTAGKPCTKFIKSPYSYKKKKIG
ncbi:hypothetical protein B14911_11252 [Bacillus sp. NRRL B-14911]|nr:hypothetical protein B14911_11252 [Bacillus sp. NRRL B-14911]